MPLRAFIAALFLCAVGGRAIAADVIGYSEAFDTLFRVNLTTHTADLVGPAGYIGGQRVANIEGLTFSPQGDLYAVADNIKGLVRINSGAGQATLVGPLNLAGQSIGEQLDLGLTFTCDGKLWLSAANGKFWQIDPTTGTSRLVGNLGVKVTGLTSRGNLIYAAGSQGNNNLYLIDPATAGVTLIGPYGSSTGYVTTASPGFDASGKLWLVLSYVPPQPGTVTIPEWSDLASLDVDTGALVNTGNITGPAVLQTSFYGELKGLALLSPTCTAAAESGVPSTPTLPLKGLVFLIVLLTLFGAFHLRNRKSP